MFCPTWKLALCLLAIGPAVHAQQSGGPRVFKVGGAPPGKSAERLSAPNAGGGHTISEVDNSQAVATVRTGGASGSTNAPQSGGQAAAAGSFAALQRDNAIELAGKRVEFARQQVADLERYNRWMPPQTQVPLAVRALPYSMSYSPVSVTDPVQSFVPRSTFAHVLVASDRELKDAELQLASLVAERDSIAAKNIPDRTAEPAGSSVDDGPQLAFLEASLQRERFLAESAERRLTQLSHLSELTYSGIYPTLYRKLELERLGHELAAQSLEHERDTLKNDASGR